MGKHRRVVPLIPIASPLAGHRLTRKLGELISQCAEQRKLVYGVKDTAKLLKTNEQGICVLGGNVSPMDVITHIPAICENQGIPYVFIPTKEQISAYAQRTSPIACVVIRAPDDDSYREKYDSVIADIQQIAPEPAPE
jgi:H/ACA ribonucleoprotein complex subunit 2